MNNAVNSPFRYAGGKFYARKLILEHVPQHASYIEPFAGGASIFFAKEKVKNNWLNDIDKNLINTFLVIRDRPEELIEKLKDEVASKERHKYFKNEFKPKTKLEEAYRWYYLNRTSYSGIMNMQNCFWGYGDKYSMRPENWPRSIRNTSEKLQNVKLTSYDFDRVLEEAEDNSFLFIDPPYFNADQDKFYTHSFKKDDHLRLCNLLKKHSKRLKYLITYDDCEEIREMYSWALEVHNKTWNYTINRTDDQTKNGKTNGNAVKGERYKGREIFILNYPSVVQKQLDLSEFSLETPSAALHIHQA